MISIEIVEMSHGGHVMCAFCTHVLDVRWLTPMVRWANDERADYLCDVCLESGPPRIAEVLRRAILGARGANDAAEVERLERLAAKPIRFPPAALIALVLSEENGAALARMSTQHRRRSVPPSRRRRRLGRARRRPLRAVMGETDGRRSLLVASTDDF